MKKNLTLFLMTLALVLVAGCSTPTSRIEKRPEVFAKFSPEEQSLIKKGQIALGFNQDMVQMALGNPDRIRTRVDGTGSKEIWSYTSYHTDASVSMYGYYGHGYAPYYRPWGPYPYYGYGGWWGYPYAVSIPYEHFRVEFRAGRVVSIEQEDS